MLRCLALLSLLILAACRAGQPVLLTATATGFSVNRSNSPLDLPVAPPTTVAAFALSATVTPTIRLEPTPIPIESDKTEPALSQQEQAIEIVGNLGGWITDAVVQNNLAYLNVGLTFVVVDVSNPALPQQIGSLLLPSIWQALTIFENRAYIATEAAIHVIDLSNPAQPTLLGNIDPPGFVTDITLRPTSSGRLYAYLTYQSSTWLSGDRGLSVIDVTDPTSPQPVGRFQTNGTPYGLTLDQRQGRIIAFLAALDTCQRAFSEGFDCTGQLRILDLSNPAQPEELTLVHTPFWARETAVQDNLLYLAEYHADFDRGTFGGLRIFDISDLTAPSELSFYNEPGEHVIVQDEKAYLDHFVVLDVSDPTNPTAINARQYWHSLIDVGADQSYFTDHEFLKIVDLSTPTSAQTIGQFDPAGPNWINAMASQNNYIYSASLGSGLSIIDITNPLNPVEVGVFNAENLFRIWEVFDQRVYAGDYDHVEIIDVSNPATPVAVGHYNSGERPILAIFDGYALINDNLTLKLVDLTNPNSPTERLLQPEEITPGAAITAGYLQNTYDEAWQIIDVTNPMAPLEVGYAPLPYDPNLVVVGDYGYYQAGNAIQIVDLTDPTHPVRRGVYQPTETLYQLTEVKEDLAYIVTDGPLQIIDVSNPGAPEKVGVYEGCLSSWTLPSSAIRLI